MHPPLWIGGPQSPQQALVPCEMGGHTMACTKCTPSRRSRSAPVKSHAAPLTSPSRFMDHILYGLSPQNTI